MKKNSHVILALVFFTAPAFANVIVSSPENGETVSSPAKFAATANSTTCSRGVAAMGVYIDNELAFTSVGASLNTSLALTDGKHNAVIQEWDNCGGATNVSVPITVESKTGVWVTSPANNSTVSWLTPYVATATTSCSKGVAAMGIYVNNQLEYMVSGAKLNTQINLSPGAEQTVVEEWDNCGGTAAAPVNLTVKGSGNTFTKLQATKGWNSWGQLAPTYADCPAPCSGVTWSMKQGVTSISLTGDATQFNIGGTTPYSDVLWENPLIGQFSTQGLPDTDEKLVPTLHNFTYDAWFFVTNASVTQALEFDVNMFLNTVGMTWGTECRVEAGNEWDIWNNAAAKWEPTGVACNPINGGWNHVTISVEREPNNTLVFESISLNGVTSNLNKTSAPFTVPSDWYGVTVNFQMDGNHAQDANTAYLDKFSFMYW
jgi:hypothetical protein